VPGRGVRAITARGETDKYVLYRQNGEAVYEQYFDLAVDPWEMTNRVGDAKYADAAKHLREELAAWEARTPQADIPQTPKPRPERRPAGRQRRLQAEQELQAVDKSPSDMNGNIGRMEEWNDGVRRINDIQ
jgi:arylsulfatase A-like enzyme